MEGCPRPVGGQNPGTEAEGGRCAGRGDFHTCAYAGPMFNHPIASDTGITVERDGFVFTDLTIPNQLPDHQITR